MSTDFLLGLLTGFISAGVVGFVATFIRAGQKRMNAFFEPQKVITKTDKSPSDVLGGCLVGFITYALIVFFVGVVLLLVYWLLE